MQWHKAHQKQIQWKRAKEAREAAAAAEAARNAHNAARAIYIEDGDDVNMEEVKEEDKQEAAASQSLWAGLQKRLALAKRALSERIADGEEQPED